MIVVVEVGYAVVVEVALGSAGAYEPEVAESRQVGQVNDAPGGCGPEATGEDVVASGH